MPIECPELFMYTFVLHECVGACVEVCCIVLHVARGNAPQCDTLLQCNTIHYLDTHYYVIQCNVTQYKQKKGSLLAPQSF